MTTEELKKELEELGLRLCVPGSKFTYYTIEDKNWNVIARVNRIQNCALEVEIAFNNLEKQQKLFHVLTEYAATPIEERKAKRYFQYKLKPLFKKQDNINDWLNFDVDRKRYILDTSLNNYGVFETVFEENSSLLNNVNLEMFDAIEVDKDGNEI